MSRWVSFSFQGAAATNGRGPILHTGCSDEALVAYLTLALRALVREVEWTTLLTRRTSAHLLTRKLVAEMDARDRGEVPAADACHCGNPLCAGCEDGREMLSRIPALDPEVRPCPECGSTHPAHHTCFIRVAPAAASGLTPVLTDARIAELIETMDTEAPARDRVELSVALTELLARRGVTS